MTPELLERICKVRRLARQSPEAGERKAAEAKLGQLLEKHQASEADLDRHEGPRAQPSPPVQPHSPFPGFPGNVVIHIVPGNGFGSVFGFGHGFGFSFTPTGTGGSGSTTTSGF